MTEWDACTAGYGTWINGLIGVDERVEAYHLAEQLRSCKIFLVKFY